MFKSIKSILFATDLSENCRQAFDFAASLATRYQATLVLLHVLEKMPNSVDGRLRGLLGEQEWKGISEKHAAEARDALIGKRSNSKLIRAALDHFCTEAGIDDAACGYQSREIVVRDGEVVEEIFDTSKTYNCDIIVMGTHEGMLTKTAVSSTLKRVLRGSKLPVVIVPSEFAEETES